MSAGISSRPLSSTVSSYSPVKNGSADTRLSRFPGNAGGNRQLSTEAVAASVRKPPARAGPLRLRRRGRLFSQNPHGSRIRLHSAPATRETIPSPATKGRELSFRAPRASTAAQKSHAVRHERRANDCSASQLRLGTANRSIVEKLLPGGVHPRRRLKT